MTSAVDAAMKAAEDALHAEERAIEKKWCKLKGHRWDLPSANPFNQNIPECETICNRCNARARVTVTVVEGA